MSHVVTVRYADRLEWRRTSEGYRADGHQACYRLVPAVLFSGWQCLVTREGRTEDAGWGEVRLRDAKDAVLQMEKEFARAAIK